MLMQQSAVAVAATASVIGVVQCWAGAVAVNSQLAKSRTRPKALPGITILKPLCGAEPFLEEALETFCRQDYPCYQIVFGAHDPNDPACRIVASLKRRHPTVDITLVASSDMHGPNRKVSNMMNCLWAVKYDVLVMADSDVHVSRDYLATVVAELERKGIGLVTSAYRGVAANRSLAARMGEWQIGLSFLPGVLVGRMLGRQDCLGATMAIQRATLDRIGGLAALAHHLDDDNKLGRLVAALGLRVAIMPGIVTVTVPETSLGDLLSHELRWGRTVRLAAPLSYALSIVQYPIVWAASAAALSGAASWSIMLLAVTWFGRATIAVRMATTLGLSRPSLGLLPVREAVSIAVTIVSFFGRKVRWRGVELELRRSGRVWLTWMARKPNDIRNVCQRP